jgi:hypothetical protein
LRDLRAQIDQRFETATTGMRGAPDAEALHALLRESDASDAQTSRKSGASKIAAHVAKRYVTVVDTVLESTLKELGRRQRDVQLALQEGSPDMLRLVELDRVLDGIFRSELELGRAQLATRLGAVLETELHGALVALTSNAAAPSVDTLRPLFGPRGCLGKFQRDARKLCHALLDLEWSALMGLLQAAMQAVTQAAPLFERQTEPTLDVEKAES